MTSQRPPADEFEESLLRPYAGVIFQACREFEDILNAGLSSASGPIDGPNKFLAVSARKLVDDVQGALELTVAGLVGPALVLARVCREIVINMLYIVSRSESDRAVFLKQYDEIGPAIERQSLRESLRRLDADVGATLAPHLRRMILDQIGTPEDIASDKETAKGEAGRLPSYRTRAAAATEWTIKRLGQFGGLPVLEFIGHAFDSEAVHSGPMALVMYSIEPRTLRRVDDVRQLQLVRLKSLDNSVSLAQLALLEGLGLLGKQPQPPSHETRQHLRGKAQAYLNEHWPDA